VDAAFAFPLVTAIRSFDKTKIVAAINRLEQAIPPGKTELVFVENHDMQRIASDPGISPEKLRTAATLVTLIKGTPLIYYGQELGMRGAPRPEYQSDEKDIGDREAFEWSSRTQAPGQANWYRSSKSYWTRRFARDDDGVSVAEEDVDPNSLLNLYRKLLALRRAHRAITGGEQRLLDSPKTILAIERSNGRERLLIIANLSTTPSTYRVRGRDLLANRDIKGTLPLGPYQSAVIELSRR
jgi:glycosidase